MPDTNTVKVDGVEPSIFVKLVDSVSNPERIKLFTAEDGTERFLVKGDENYFPVTNNDLAQLGGYEIELEPTSAQTPAVQPAQNRPESTIVIPTPATTPGQTG